MTASQIPFRPGALTAPVVDYEPPPIAVAGQPAPQPAVAAQPAPQPAVAGQPAPQLDVAGQPAPQLDVAALHRPSRRPLRPVDPASRLAPPPPSATAFADAALRRVLEVIDRRRPIAQLRPLLTPALLDMVFTLTRGAGPDKAAVLRRVRLRTAAIDDREPHRPMAAEVFATYTRGGRVRAIAGRIEDREGRWRMVALQVG